MFVCKIITTDLLACVNYPEVKKNFNFDVLISNLSFHSTFVILIWLVTICSLIRRFFFGRIRQELLQLGRIRTYREWPTLTHVPLAI